MPQLEHIEAIENRLWKTREIATARTILDTLEEDLRATKGKPLGRGWQHLGPVRQYAANAYHCHLTRDIVALWTINQDSNENIIITVCTFEYIGSRGKAPY